MVTAVSESAGVTSLASAEIVGWTNPGQSPKIATLLPRAATGSSRENLNSSSGGIHVTWDWHFNHRPMHNPLQGFPLRIVYEL